MVQEMREHKKRVTDLDWSLENHQLLTSAGASDGRPRIMTQLQCDADNRYATSLVRGRLLLRCSLQRMAVCVCHPMTMASGLWRGGFRRPPLPWRASFTRSTRTCERMPLFVFTVRLYTIPCCHQSLLIV